MSAQPRRPIATFRWVCQAISPLVGEERLRATLPSSVADWDFVVRVASSHLVLPSLYVALRDKGLLAATPRAFAEALEGFHTLNALHNARLRKQMLDVSSLLNDIGVSPVWLKGATNLLGDDWQNVSRMMLDLDFWVPDSQCHSLLLARLEQAGYVIPDDYRGLDFGASHHFAPRVREGEPARIEIHHKLVSTRVCELLDDQEVLPFVEWFTWEGKQVGCLSMLDRLRHSYIQCTEMNGGMAQGRISLLKALDFVERLEASGGPFSPIFLAQLDSPPWRTHARHFFSFLEDYFGLPSALAYDRSLLRRMEWSIAYPRSMYGLHMLEHAWNVVISGRAGHPRTWLQKLSRHLEILRQRSSEM